MKKVFYYTDVLPFLSRGEDAVDKLKRNLEVFKEEQESIRLVWHPWSKTEEYLELNKSDVIKDYKEIIDTYLSEGWGELDRSKSMSDAKEAMLKCDAYYGDSCDLIYEAQNAKMPVMIQNVDC